MSAVVIVDYLPPADPGDDACRRRLILQQAVVGPGGALENARIDQRRTARMSARMKTMTGQSRFRHRRREEVGTTERWARDAHRTQASLKHAGGAKGTIDGENTTLSESFDDKPLMRQKSTFHVLGPPTLTWSRIISPSSPVHKSFLTRSDPRRRRHWRRLWHHY